MTTSDSPGVVAHPPGLYLGALVVVLALRWLWPAPMFAGGVAFWPGLACLAIGFGLAVWGSRTMEAAGTNVNPKRPATAIVTAGPFRYSRNPLYCSLTLVYVGLVLTLNTWWGLVVLVPLLAVMHFGVVRREERYLERKFGDSYRQYRATVRRYF